MSAYGLDPYCEALMDERGTALWRARLSDGSVVTMDDGRPGLEPASAWLRLRLRLSREHLAVQALWLVFRNNSARPVSENADGYFFSKCAIGEWGSPETLNFYLIGALHEGRLVVQRWLVPGLSYVDSSSRDPAKAGEALITNGRPPRPL